MQPRNWRAMQMPHLPVPQAPPLTPHHLRYRLTTTMKIKTNSANAGRSQDMRAPLPAMLSQAPSKVRLAAAVALSGLLLSVAQPAAPQSRAQESATITPNYKDADLSQIIQ